MYQSLTASENTAGIYLLLCHCVPQSHYYILVCCVLKRVVKHCYYLFPQPSCPTVLSLYSHVETPFNLTVFFEPTKGPQKKCHRNAKICTLYIQDLQSQMTLHHCQKTPLYFQLCLPFSIVGTSNVLSSLLKSDSLRTLNLAGSSENPTQASKSVLLVCLFFFFNGFPHTLYSQDITLCYCLYICLYLH